MEVSKLKTILKEVVREVFQEELKELLLEAIKSPKNTIVETTLTPKNNTGNPISTNTLTLTQDIKNSLKENYLKNAGLPGNFTTENIPTQPLQIQGYTNTTEGQLPPGEISLDMISQFMRK